MVKKNNSLLPKNLWKLRAFFKKSEHPQTQNEVSWVLQLLCTSESQSPIFNGEWENTLWGYSAI